MKNINHINEYFDKEVDVFTSGAGTIFRGILRRIYPNSGPGSPQSDVVEIEPTRDFDKMFGKTIVNVGDIAAVRIVQS